MLGCTILPSKVLTPTLSQMRKGARMQAVLRGHRLPGGEELGCSTVQGFTILFGSLIGVERNRCAVAGWYSPPTCRLPFALPSR